MKFYNVKGHIIVDLDGARYVVDTGSALSFSFNKGNRVTINGKGFPLNKPEAYGVKPEVINWVIGENVDGIIGNDIITKTSLTINYFTNDIFFEVVDNHECRERRGLPLEYEKGVLTTIGIIIGDNTVKKSIIDTGAIFSFVSRDYLSDGQKFSAFSYDRTDEGEIFGPTYAVVRGLWCMGHWETLSHILVGAIEDNEILIRKAKAFGAEAIIGTKDLGSLGNVILDFTNAENPSLVVFVNNGVLTAKEAIERRML